MEKFKSLPIGHQLDWKFGLITRTIVRLDVDLFEINDTSDGWTSVEVTTSELGEVLEGKKSLLSLDWK